ncbi:MAG: alkaline phosphatase [Gemmatimonadota bacterium]
MSGNRRIVLLIVTLAVLLASWQSRHSIIAAVRRLLLPTVDPPPPGTIRFAVIGDYGSGTAMERDVAQLIESWSPGFVATVGDNDYEEGATGGIDEAVGQFYHGFIAPYHGKYGRGAAENRFFPIPGHRDWDHSVLRPYLEYFTLPGNERYYDLVRGPVHLFMLDTDEREPDGATAGSIQAQWLEQQLARSTSRWNLVFAHHAPYTSHRVEDIARMRWPFKAWGADAVLSGFYHVYERLMVDSLPYFIDGVGGSSVSGFGQIDSHSRFRYAADYGALLVDATDARITFRFVTRSGRIVDEYSLVKASPKNKSR